MGSATIFDADIIKKVMGYTYMTDTFMNKAFNKPVAEHILSVILERKLTVLSVETQHDVGNLFGRGCRFDVWAVDDNGVRYNIEVQNANEGADPKRARYNVERADSEVIAKSTDYKNFPELYVIMITKEDVLQKGLPIYHVERYIKETMTPFGDAEHVIYVNGSAKDANTPLGQLMRDMQEPDASKIDCPELASRMVEIKHGEEITTMCQELQEERLKGIEKGIEKGIAENQLKNVKSLMKKGFTMDWICDTLGISDADRDKIQKQLDK